MKKTLAGALTALSITAFAGIASGQALSPAPAPDPAAAPAAAPAAPSDPNLPLAKVGDIVVTADDFARFARFRLRRLSVEAGKKIEPDAKFRSQTMNELIASRIMEVLAKEAKVAVSDEDIAKDFEESKKNFKNAEEYDRYLKEQNLNEGQLREEVRRKLLLNKFMEENSKGIEVTNEEIQKRYDELKTQGKMNRDTRTADIAQIVALFKPNDAESEKDAKAKIESVRARIAKGEKFEDIGKEVSKDITAGMQMGIIEEARPSALFPDIGKAVEALKSGEVSEALKTPRGYGIVTVKAWYDPGVVPIEKVQDKIKAQIFTAKQHDAVSALVKGARDRVPVEIYKANASEVPAAAGAPAAPGAPAASPAPDASGKLTPSDLSNSQ